MKLNPVYLLAPKPKPRSIPSRRAFLIAGGTFLAGVGLGGACGYAAGARGSVDVDDASLPEPSGDAELDELRRLALKAPIEELVGKWPYFTDAFATRYRNDQHLPTGVERLVDHVTANETIAQRRVLARVLAQTILLGEVSLQERLGHHVPSLNKIR